MPHLILTEPNANPIRTYKNGVKVIRPHEFLGPARGTLSTESDPISVCGTVIRDTQTVAYTGTFQTSTIQTNLVTSGLDTCRIHMDDLNLNPRWHYQMYMGVRGEGDIDATRENESHTFFEIGSNTAIIAGYIAPASLVAGTAVGGTAFAPRPSLTDYYKIVRSGGFFSGHFTEGNEWLLIRAATGTGGSFEWLLDVIYLVPYLSTDAIMGPNNPYVDSDFRRILPDGDFEPVYDVKTDTWNIARDDEDLAWVGQFSNMITSPPGFIGGQEGGHADYQVGETEKSLYNVFYQFPDDQWLVNPSCDLTFIFGSHHAPSHAIDSDSFSRTTPESFNAYHGSSDEGRTWYVAAHSGVSSIFSNGSELEIKEGFYDVAGSIPQDFPQVGVEPNQAGATRFMLGAEDDEVGTPNGTLQGHKTLAGMNHCIFECKVSTDFVLVAGFEMLAGFKYNLDGDGIYATLSIPTQGFFGGRASAPINLYLKYFPTDFANRPDEFSIPNYIEQEYLDGPVSLGTYTPNTWMRIKIEMMWYRFRAKAWFDGDSEPGSWQVEGFIPSGYDAIVDADNFLYPYEDDPIYGSVRRTDMQLYPTIGINYYRPQEDMLGNSTRFTSEFTRVTSSFFDDVTIDYDAYGEDPTDVHIHLEKHDDSIDFGSLTIPHGSQRMIIAPTGRYMSNESQDGVSFTFWKEEGAPDTQAAVLHDTYIKRIIPGPVHLHIRYRPYEEAELNPDEEEA